MICCGKPMRLKDGKYMCRKCKAWFIPGFAPAATDTEQAGR